jgi:hypothetical protein
MKALLTILTATLLTAGASAQAQEVPAWLCNMNFSGTNKSVQIIVGKSEFNGKGTVSCVSAHRERVEFPIKVTMSSKPIAPRVGLGKMELYGQALQIALTNDQPESLLGSYLVAEGRAALVGGAGVIAAVRASDKNFSLNISLQLVKGFGVDLGFRKMKIELDNDRLN